MPRSIKRRLELLERRPGKAPGRVTPEEWVDSLEGLVAGGHPLTAREPFLTSSADYLAGRARVGALRDPPPPAYSLGEPEDVRWRRWSTWHHPSLNPAICRMLTAIIDQADTPRVSEFDSGGSLGPRNPASHTGGIFPENSAG